MNKNNNNFIIKLIKILFIHLLKMGLSCDKSETKLQNLMNKFQIMKNCNYLITNHTEIKINDVFLISTQSIPNFIKCIEDSNILNKEEHLSLELLKDKFKNIGIEENAIILSKYIDCRKISEDDNLNQFIIVDKRFFSKEYEVFLVNKSVTIESNKKKKIKKIIFNCLNSIDFDDNVKGTYKFIYDENNLLKLKMFLYLKVYLLFH